MEWINHIIVAIRKSFRNGDVVKSDKVEIKANGDCEVTLQLNTAYEYPNNLLSQMAAQLKAKDWSVQVNRARLYAHFTIDKLEVL